MRIVFFTLVGALASACASPQRPTSPATAAATTAAAATSPLTLDRLFSEPGLLGTSPSSPTWSPDGTALAFLWREPTGARREVYLVDADGTGLRRLTSEAEGDAAAAEVLWAPGGRALLYRRAGELWQTDLQGNSRPVAQLGDGASDLGVSPDGRFASFRKDGDLWLASLADGALRQLTAVGVPSISKVPLGRYRRAEVEIGTYVWGGPTYAWSPDGKRIAVHYVDRRSVRQTAFPHYLGERTDPNFVRRSNPGDANEARRVGIVDVDTGQLHLLDLPDPTSVRVVDFAWSSAGRLLIDRESDTAVDRWLHIYDPNEDDLRPLWHDRRESRIYTTSASAWHPDGEHVIVLADLADRYGLYALSTKAPDPRLLTSAAFDVTSGPVVTTDGSIFYQSNEPSPYERHVFRTTLAGGSVRLSQQPGEALPYPAPDGKRLAVLHGSDARPRELFVVDTTDNDASFRQVTRSQPDTFEQTDWATARYVTFPSLHDDATLHARILEPKRRAPGKRYPVLFGPVYSNTVRNRWGGFYALFQQLLVARGYLVVQVDVRGSTGYGRAFREQFLADFAGRDLGDLESAVRYLEDQPYVDPERIGVWGSSYGGTLTVYALLKKPGLFDAGVACAAAVDPFFFGSDDVAIVRRPGTHPRAFERGAAQYAGNLADPLLLIHGMQDQVVPFKTVVALADALMRAGKDFDFAFAPAATHRWTARPQDARYLLGKLLAHFDRHLSPEPD